MERLTQKDEQGNWCIRGLRWEDTYPGAVITRNTYERIYGVSNKLLDYEDTGLAPEQVRELAEKQKPMKVEKLKSAQYPYRCPACGYLLEIGYKHCISCGQRVKYEWEEVR